MNIKEFIVKLQNLPLEKKKVILWSIVILLAIIMGFFWIKSIAKRAENIKMGEFIQGLNLPPVGEEIKNLGQQKGIIENQKESENLQNDQELLKELKKEATPEQWQALLEELKKNATPEQWQEIQKAQ